MNQKIKTLKIIHFSICVGVVFLFLFLGQSKIEELNLQIQVNDLIYLAIPIGAILIGNFLFSHRLKELTDLLNPDEKFAIYQSASIIRWAVLEGAALFILIAFSHLWLFGILLILYLIMLYPSREKIERIFQSNIH